MEYLIALRGEMEPKFVKTAKKQSKITMCFNACSFEILRKKRFTFKLDVLAHVHMEF
jgi:hypothetical protein